MWPSPCKVYLPETMVLVSLFPREELDVLDGSTTTPLDPMRKRALGFARFCLSSPFRLVGNDSEQTLGGALAPAR